MATSKGSYRVLACLEGRRGWQARVEPFGATSETVCRNADGCRKGVIGLVAVHLRVYTLKKKLLRVYSGREFFCWQRTAKFHRVT